LLEFSVDYELAQTLDPSKSKDEFYTNIQSAAESGWDFSSRWFMPEESEMKGIHCSAVESKLIFSAFDQLSDIQFLPKGTSPARKREI